MTPSDSSLPARDPAFIRSQLLWMSPIADHYFRADVRHMSRIPAGGPALIVGNHSGGLMTPDSFVFAINFFRHFGADRTAYVLAHQLVAGAPVLGWWLRKMGTVNADPAVARKLLHQGAAVMVYPGGDEDVFRSWRDRNRIHLAKRTGFIRLALQENVPIIPVVSIGGHETALVLSGGKKIAQVLGTDRLFRINSLPLVVAPPWGISPGDLLFHIPLPAKITIEVGRPIDFATEFGRLDPNDPEVVWGCYHLVEQRMQKALDKLAKQRKLPVLG